MSMREILSTKMMIPSLKKQVKIVRSRLKFEYFYFTMKCRSQDGIEFTTL